MISHKNIVVTGASSGIGKSIMDELVGQEGNRILAACRRAEKITGYGSNVIPFSCDLSTKEGVDALFAKAEEVFEGHIDLYFCNAGAPYYERFDYEDWERVQRIFDLNTVGHIYTNSSSLFISTATLRDVRPRAKRLAGARSGASSSTAGR